MSDDRQKEKQDFHTGQYDGEKVKEILIRVEAEANRWRFQKDSSVGPKLYETLQRCSREARSAFNFSDLSGCFESLYGAVLAYQLIGKPMDDPTKKV